MDFDKRLEAVELMWRLLGQSSSVPTHYCHAVNTRWLRLVTEDNQLSGHSVTIARPITVIIVMSGPRRKNRKNTRECVFSADFRFRYHQIYLNSVLRKISSCFYWILINFLGNYRNNKCVYLSKMLKKYNQCQKLHSMSSINNYLTIMSVFSAVPATATAP